MDDQDEVVAAVAVDVADGQVARLDEVAGAAEDLRSKTLKLRAWSRSVSAGVGDDLDELLGRCR